MYSIVANYLYTLRMFSHDVRMYLVTAALLGFSYFGIIAVLMNLYLLRLGYGPEFIGLVNGATSTAFALTSLPAGAIGRSWGNRRSVVVGISLVILGIGFLPMLPLAGVVGSLVGGVLPGFFANQLNLTLEQPGPYRYPLIIASLLTIPAVWALLTTTEPQEKAQLPPMKHAPSVLSQSYRATPIMLIVFLAICASFRMAGEGAARSFFNVYLDVGLGVSTAQIGVLTAVSQLLAVPAALAAPILITRQGKVPVVVFATLGISASLMLMAFVPHWLSAGLSFMGITAMLSITRAVTNIYQMEVVTADWRSFTSGVISMAMGIGFSSMTLGGGYLIQAVGFQGLYFIAAISVMCSALIFWAYFRTPRGEYATGTV